MRISKQLFIFFMSFFFGHAILCNALESNSDNIIQLANLIHKRYYLIHRMEKPIKLLLSLYEKIEKTKFVKPKLVDHGVHTSFQHELIQKNLILVEQYQKINPIKKIWQDFLTYNFIESDTFSKETIVLTMMVYKNIIKHLTESHYLKVGTQELYDTFNAILNVMQESHDCAHFFLKNTLRFYYVQRLFKPMVSIIKLEKKYAQVFVRIQDVIAKLPLKHPNIRRCMLEMRSINSIKPLVTMWQDFIAYKYINDDLFLKEFVIVLFIMYSQVKNFIASKRELSMPSMEQVVEVYDQIAALPINDLLAKLDDTVEQLIVILETHEFNTPMSWPAWLKKYWWLAPVSIGAIWLKFLTKKSPKSA